MTRPPTLNDLRALAERALAHAEGETQATALWEVGGAAERLTVDLTCVIDGRAATGRAQGTTDEALRRAARAAALHARRARAWPTPGLPDPLEGRPHEASFDPAALRPLPAVEVPAPRVELGVRAGAARIAIASTRGVRAAEQRSHVVAAATVATPSGPAVLRAAATGPGTLPLAELLEAASALAAATAGDPVTAPDAELPVVFGHDAVATLLDHLRPAFGVELDLGSGPLHGRFGTRVAAAAVNLSDSPRHPSTLPRAFDAEGLPRRPVPLIQDGVAHGRVHDTASAAAANLAGTGHATRAAALAPLPEHLVLAGGGAADLAELCAPVAEGLYVPALSPAREADGDAYRHTALGTLLVRDGELVAPVAAVDLLIDPLGVLASVEALTARSRTLPLAGHAPGGPGAAVVPAIRASGGWRRAR